MKLNNADKLFLVSTVLLLVLIFTVSVMMGTDPVFAGIVMMLGSLIVISATFLLAQIFG